MVLGAREIAKLRRIIEISVNLIASVPPPKRGRPPSTFSNGAPKLANKRSRRTGKDLTEFRKMLKSERRNGAPVAEIAKRHQISASYIYQL